MLACTSRVRSRADGGPVAAALERVGVGSSVGAGDGPPEAAPSMRTGPALAAQTRTSSPSPTTTESSADLLTPASLVPGSGDRACRDHNGMVSTHAR